jgi:hypothetical protein
MMRAWGRVYDEFGNYTWQEVTTDPAGRNDYVYITNLIQVLKLNRNESPFFADYGIPGQLSVIQQIFPDIYASLTQVQFAPFFASLIITKLPSSTPTYRVNLTTNQGVKFEVEVPV